MKATRPYPKAIVTPKAERAIAAGHPWVYDAEVISLDAAIEQTDANCEPNENPYAESMGATNPAVGNGSIVDVVNRKGTYLGSGTVSQHSKIRIRLITRNANDRFDDAFWERKVRWCWEYRKVVLGDDVSSCRVIFSEGDGFPGLIVDKFEDVLVAEVLSIGMEVHKPQIFAALLKVMDEDGIAIRGIYERNDAATRKLEGLEQGKGWYGQKPTNANTSVNITENGVRYTVDFENGQKTGFFLDQKYNRRAVGKLARGRRVLDCFTHTGSFALNAALSGAEHVNAVDISQLAIDQARANAQLNGIEDRMSFTCANVFELLTQLEQERCRDYDFIILDPPAFTKNRRNIEAAARGYKDINYRAMRILPRGGYLATASCSHFMDTERFKKMLASAAHDAGVQLRQIEERQQAPDHPILWGIPETNYLKFFIFQVI